MMGILEIQFGHGSIQLFFQPPDNHTDFAVEDIADIFQTALVIFFRLVPFAWPFAIAALVFQTYPKFAACNMLRCQRQVAGRSEERRVGQESVSESRDR